MSNTSPLRPQAELELMTELWDKRISDDVEAFVLFAFPWGKENTPLHNVKGPRVWQRDELQAMTEHIRVNRDRMARNIEPLVYKSAKASGRGIGKSTFVSWLTLWMMSTRVGSTIIITANNETQLKSRTLAELGKWHTLSLNEHWFERSSMQLKPQPWFEEALRRQLKVDTGYYYTIAQLWNEASPESFAGVHNQNGVMVLFDEASGIPKSIWTITSGFFTEPTLDRYQFAFSNPRRNTGQFFECFHKNRSIWRHTSIDSRNVEGTDKNELANIIKEHGEDSDEARVEVKGEFPRQGDKQFISRSIVNDAIQRELINDSWAPLMMGVDPARFGNDETVIRFRQGRNGNVIPAVKMRMCDNMTVANKCADLIQKYNPDAVCIDAGNGTGIIDRLKEMKYKVHEVWFGSKSPQEEYFNYRTYLWAQMREWLSGACIDNDQDLQDDLTSPEYKFMGTSDKIRLETKEELSKKGFSSCDNADALACTFAVKVPRLDTKVSRHSENRMSQMARDIDYPIF